MKWKCVPMLIVMAVVPVLQAQSVSPARTPAKYGKWGFDPSGEDGAIRPGDNFFQYANGTYLQHLVIPADHTGYGLTSETAALTEGRIRGLIEEQVAHPGPTADDRRVAALYAAFMDEKTIERVGTKPLEADLARVRAIQSKAEMAAYMGASRNGFGASVFDIHTEPDFQDPTHYALIVGETEQLGLPGREYYLDARFAEKKATYQSYVARMLTLAKWPDADAEAKDVVSFETELAQALLTAEQDRDRSDFYHPADLAALRTMMAGFDVQRFLAAAGVSDQTHFVVTASIALPKIAAVFAGTPLETMKAWEAFEVTQNASAELPSAFVQSEFELHERDLSGQQELTPRWKRALQVENDALGEAVGRLYVERYFPLSSKVAMEELVANLKSAFRARLADAVWLSPATKQEAIAKLDAMGVKVGYPSRWRTYEFAVTRGDLYGDVKRGRAWDWHEQIEQLHHPTDRAAWGLLPQDDFAMNEGSLNAIVFPAAFLQPPFFDPAADPAVNYGAIGVVIGHEMTHGFDDQGRKVDHTGRLRDWWTAEDAAQFNVQADKLAAQYSAFEPLPGVHVNGRLTLGEDIADMGGVAIALDAYHRSLSGQPAAVLDGTTGDQRFFLSCAQVWRTKRREDALRQQLADDPHPPAEPRVNGEVRNNDAWYSAFDVKPGDKLYVAPKDRVRLW
ncbi:peptidase M13 [Granulicella sp. 5B5]|uniref:M13 family metallopeptidase n=1 Tax=Granulicella sp. 5B5 TaxID=1617967 RepID=UPI0015F64270|nr:M13 family metallopeptidase [Granulicella sp. 5B5]QMV18100.1 peptidase M13 [Granulicella sp. 5B5]